jgi:polyphosphate kinase
MSTDNIITFLKRKKIIPTDSKILQFDQRIIEYANVVPLLGRLEALEILCENLEKQNVFLAGRFGRWEYLWSVEAARSGYEAATLVQNSLIKNVE